MSADAPFDGRNPRYFATTHWTVVIEAGEDGGDKAQRALEALCSTYWYPLYAFARGMGRSQEAAEDLVQSFFAQLIEKNSVRLADQSRGRFRSFLLTSFKRFSNNEWARGQAQKRGGGIQVLSLDYATGERRWEEESARGGAPDEDYERRWAITLIQNARQRLRQEFVESGKADRFDALEPHLAGDPDASGYSEIAKQFGISTGGVKAEAFRLRQRYRNHLRAEVANTLSDQGDVDDEIAYLMKVLSHS